MADNAATASASAGCIPPLFRARRAHLAILSTHPIQYHAHWFRALAARPELDLSVFYCY